MQLSTLNLALSRIYKIYSSFDADASAYIAAVELADGQSLEENVKIALNKFVVNCKKDGVWDAIKASCILAGARTLSGALVPLKGTAPTNYNFVSGDYNRKTGLIGNGSTKYLDSKRTSTDDPQNSEHQSVYISIGVTGLNGMIGSGATGSDPGSDIHIINNTASNVFLGSRNRGGTLDPVSGSTAVSGFVGISRAASTSYTRRYNSSDTTLSVTSSAPTKSIPIYVFARSSQPITTPTAEIFSAQRMSFYSIGESLTLSALDTNVSNLMTDLGTAIV